MHNTVSKDYLCVSNERLYKGVVYITDESITRKKIVSYQSEKSIYDDIYFDIFNLRTYDCNRKLSNRRADFV